MTTPDERETWPEELRERCAEEWARAPRLPYRTSDLREGRQGGSEGPAGSGVGEDTGRPLTEAERAALVDQFRRDRGHHLSLEKRAARARSLDKRNDEDETPTREPWNPTPPEGGYTVEDF